MDTLAGDRPTTRGDTVGGTADDSRVDVDEFVLARSTALLRTAYLLTRDHALAEDLLQTALTKAWFAWPRIETNPETYVRKILVNTFASWWRRKWNGEHEHGDLPEPDPSHPGGLGIKNRSWTPELVHPEALLLRGDTYDVELVSDNGPVRGSLLVYRPE